MPGAGARKAGNGRGTGLRWGRPALALALVLGSSPAVWADAPLDGITFAVGPGGIYLPVAEAGEQLGWTVSEERNEKLLRLNGHPLPCRSLRQLVDGSWLVTLDDLAKAGATVTDESDRKRVTDARGKHPIEVVVGPKRAVVDLGKQRLMAWQGERLVLNCRVSSGRNGRTPAGSFVAGPYKARMHYSKRYDNAPMPWSVQINGNVFIHGFTSVPDHPASHGCIRVPLDEGNPARFFYEWIDVGTPVLVKAKD